MTVNSEMKTILSIALWMVALATNAITITSIEQPTPDFYSVEIVWGEQAADNHSYSSYGLLFVVAHEELGEVQLSADLLRSGWHGGVNGTLSADREFHSVVWTFADGYTTVAPLDSEQFGARIIFHPIEADTDEASVPDGGSSLGLLLIGIMCLRRAYR